MPQTIDFFEHVAEDPGQSGLRQRVQGRVGALHPPRRRGRAVPLEPARGRQGRAARRARPAELGGAALGRRAGAGRLRRWRASGFHAPTARCTSTRCAAPRAWPRRGAHRVNRVAYAAAHVVADPLADADPWLQPAIDWDATLAYRSSSLVARLRRRRSDGHRAARHGPRLADLARADRSVARARARHARRGHRLRRGHRPSRSPRATTTLDRRHRRLRGAMRGDREPRRPHHPHGEPRAGRVRAHRRTTTSRSTAAS